MTVETTTETAQAQNSATPLRDPALFPLYRSVTDYPGVGNKTALAIGRAVSTRTSDGIPTALELLYHPPLRFIDRRRITQIAHAPSGEISTLSVRIIRHNFSDERRRPHRVEVADETGEMTLAFFNARADYLTKTYPLDEERWISGTIETFGQRKQMLHPDYSVSEEDRDELPTIEAVYPSTAGLSLKVLRKAMGAALDDLIALSFPTEDWWPPALRPRAIKPWLGWRDAVLALHDGALQPDVRATARARLALDELSLRQVRLAERRAHRKQEPAPMLTFSEEEFAKALAIMPFELTGDQIKAAREIRQDLSTGAKSVRLVQGDVGSGKTAVALVAAYLNALRGRQTALLAPTEVLSRQHARLFANVLEPLGVQTQLLTGKLKGPERRQAEASIRDGQAQVIIGTQALFQDKVDYHDLGYVVIDEQHRFGVAQRERLLAKGVGTQALMMSATPIPRSMTMVLYGDLDVSIIREKPKGRKEVSTAIKPLNQSGAVYDRLVGLLSKDPDARAFWVCPLIEESDKLDATAAISRYDSLLNRFPAEKLALVHGRLSSEEKEAEVDRFARGTAQLLVATTVIEVGIDVPNATVMVVESAERFGLAQLHQLRGRVGRGDKGGSCLLLYGDALGETSQSRLKLLRASNDGFEIAEEDIRLRGGGDILGVQQTGLPVFRFADLAEHQGLMEEAERLAQLALEKSLGLDILKQLFPAR